MADSRKPKDTLRLPPDPLNIEDKVRKSELKAKLFGKPKDRFMIGPYEVLERIGSGGMGSLFKSLDPSTGDAVAVKVLTCASPEGDSRMRREARALRAIEHPNVVRIRDFGRTQDGAYYVMDYVDGQTMRQWHEHEPAWDAVLGMFVQVADGMIAAHAKGIVHRDVKPDNVVIDGTGTAKLIDFGLAKALEGSEAEAMTGMAEPLTNTGASMGTFGYVSPEQLEGRPIDEKTDQFAFCAALFEALYGRLPFERPTPMETGLAVLQGTIDPPPDIGSVPAALHEAILTGLSRQPQDRHASMGDLVGILRSMMP